VPQQQDHDEKPVVLEPVEARQGFLGRPVLIVLIVSTVLAAIGLLFSGLVTLGPGAN
jgi:hypothetical protein